MPFHDKCKECYNSVFLPSNYYDKEYDLSHSYDSLSYDTKDKQSKNIFKTDFINKSVHISKLRNILTDTISNVTKEKKLKKGESVELTLEIEILKSESNTPTNSLVEVTILQHNNKKDYKNKTNSIQLYSNNMQLKNEINCSSSESLSLKQRNWFKKIVNSQSQENNVSYEKCTKNKTITNENNQDFNGYEMVHIVASNESMKTDYNHRKNFITGLSEEILANSITKCPKPNNINNISTNGSSLIKTLSNVFLPTKKVQKCAEPAALNCGVNNIKHKSEKNTVFSNTKVKRKGTVHNLGKLVSNISVDKMECSHSKKYQSVQYKCYFEPIITTSRNYNNFSKTTTTLKNITGSYSDTCIEYSTEETLNAKQNNSMNACHDINQSIEPANEFQNIAMGDSSPNHKNINRYREKFLPQSQRKNGRGDEIPHHRHKLENKLFIYEEQDKPLYKENSTIYWNGETIEINKEIKKRIEMLIFNELQNVALKEGMECDVTTLSSTGESVDYTKKVEKVSSFICELDISDTKINKTMKNRKSLERKYKMKQSQCRQKKRMSKHIKSKCRFESKETDQTTPMSSSNVDNSTNKKSKTNSFKAHHSGKNNQKKTLNLINNAQDSTTYAEVKYLNLKYSSSESHNVALKSAVESELRIKSINNVFIERKSNSEEKIFAKGFVKKIESNDPAWKDFLCNKTLSVKRSREYKIKTSSNMLQYNSVTSKECGNKIEIELNVQDLELLLKEAKDKYKASKIFLSSKCNNCKNDKYKRAKRFNGKNSPSYTNFLLTKAAKKLEKYAKVKRPKGK